MGGAVSSGESNDELIDNLLESDYIKTVKIERIFRAVDRGMYYTEAHKSDAYKDLAWKDGNLHLSAPCIYSEVMENIGLGPGMSFLNMGSGTGYLSTMCGLIIGRNGINHGIELHPEVAEYAREKLEEFVRTSPAIDGFDFCIPEFVVGNCLNPISTRIKYDRIYCGAACPEDSIRSVTDLLKVGGICVMPINDSLVKITRTSGEAVERKSLLPVSFASLIEPGAAAAAAAAAASVGANAARASGVLIDKKKPEEVVLPALIPPSLKELCRVEIRSLIRTGFTPPGEQSASYGMDEQRLKRKRRQARQERRRASRLLVVQRRRAGGPDGDAGFVAVAYSLGNGDHSDADSEDIAEIEHYVNQSSDDDDDTDDDDDDDEGHGYYLRAARRNRARIAAEAAAAAVTEARRQQDNEMIEEDDEDDGEMPDLEDSNGVLVPKPETQAKSVAGAAAAVTSTTATTSGATTANNGQNQNQPTPPTAGGSQSQIRGPRRVLTSEELIRGLEAAAAALVQQQNNHRGDTVIPPGPRPRPRTPPEEIATEEHSNGTRTTSTSTTRSYPWVNRLSEAYDHGRRGGEGERFGQIRRGIMNAVSTATRTVLGVRSPTTANNDNSGAAPSTTSSPSQNGITATGGNNGSSSSEPDVPPTSGGPTASTTTSKRRGAPTIDEEPCHCCHDSSSLDSSSDSDTSTTDSSENSEEGSADEDLGGLDNTLEYPTVPGSSAESGIVLDQAEGNGAAATSKGARSTHKKSNKKLKKSKSKKPAIRIPPPAPGQPHPPPPEYFEELQREERARARLEAEEEDEEDDEETEEEEDNSPAAKLKRNPISTEMRKRIPLLPLPPPLQAYLHFYRPFDLD